MYKVAILGCENSHADFFLEYISKQVPDVEVVGIYSEEADAAQRLHKQYGVYVAEDYTEFVGKIDGLIITARHGDLHYLYAKPYIADNIPMFIDKPITVSEQDAVSFAKELKKNNIPVSGGTVCKYANYVQKLKNAVRDNTYGTVYGGYLRAPFIKENKYGGFFFYAQHMIQVMCEIFGYAPVTVQTFSKGDTCTCVFRYDTYDVVGVFVDGNTTYYAGISCDKTCEGSVYTLEDCSEREFDAFYRLLKGEKQTQSYEEFMAPVFIMNAVHRSMESGKEETIHTFHM